MTIDNEIKLAQQEKVFNDSVNILMENLGINGKIQLDEAECLNLKYSPIAEELRNFDYNSALNEYVKNGISTLEEANELNYILEAFDEEILDESNTESKEFGHLYGKTKNREDLEKGHKAAIRDFIKRGTNGEDLKSRSTPDTGNHGIEVNGKHYKTTRGRARKTANDIIYKDILKKRAWNKNHPGVPYPTPEEKHEKMSKIGRENVMKRYNKEKVNESYIEYLLEDNREFYNTISDIRFLIEDAKDRINENDISGYKDLARVYITLNKNNLNEFLLLERSFNPDEIIKKEAYKKISRNNIGVAMTSMAFGGNGFMVYAQNKAQAKLLASKLAKYIANDKEGLKLYNELKEKLKNSKNKTTPEIKRLGKEFISFINKISIYDII